MSRCVKEENLSSFGLHKPHLVLAEMLNLHSQIEAFKKILSLKTNKMYDL